MKKQSYLNPKAEVKSPSIHRRGVFAKQKIKKDELIAVWGGRVISWEEYDRIIKKGFKDHGDYSIQVADGFYLSAINEKEVSRADFFNHSCCPNAGIKGQILLVAMKDIKPNEEITFDYAMAVTDQEFSLRCNCGAKNCRKIITGNDWQIPALQRKYQGYFSWYIQEKINVNI